MLAGLALPPGVEAQFAVSSNDNRVMLDNGVVKVVPNPAPDTATVVDLRASPPAVIATLEAGKGAAGVSINRQGTLALVANRAEGTVSVFTIQGKTVAPAGLVRVADDKSGPSHVAFTPDGKTALLTRDGDSMISILAVDGTKVEYTKRDLSAGLRPYGLDISADGSVAVVANIGRGGGDNDTVSVIDLRATPIRVVETVTVGQTPEGIILSPDGKLCAVQVMNGSNKPRESPFHAANGKLLLYRVEGTRLVPVAAAWVGHWSQGVAFSADSRTIPPASAPPAPPAWRGEAEGEPSG